MTVLKSKKIKLILKKIEFEPPRITGGLAKTHKIIRTDRIKELQFLKLCEQIELNENKQKRAFNQRNERALKRNKIQKSNEIIE